MTMMMSLLGKKIEQIACSAPAFRRFIGRKAIVIQEKTDEKGAVHILTDDGIWCPIGLIRIAPSICEDCFQEILSMVVHRCPAKTEPFTHR